MPLTSAELLYTVSAGSLAPLLGRFVPFLQQRMTYLFQSWQGLEMALFGHNKQLATGFSLQWIGNCHSIGLSGTIWVITGWPQDAELDRAQVRSESNLQELSFHVMQYISEY